MAFTWSTLWLACLSLGLVALARSATADASSGADSHARSAEPPRVRVEPERQVVRPGDSPRFRCRVESERPYSIHWEAVGRGHPWSSNTSDDHATLQFHNIPVADQGRYICLASNNYGTAQAAVEVVVEESTTTSVPMTTHETPAVDLGALLDAGAMITLVAGDTRLAAHKAVLTARSPVFKAVLSGNTPEASSGQLDIADVEGPVLRQLVAYLYTLQVPQLSSMAPQLLAAADTYGVSGLKAACERQVVAQLAVENAATSAALAVRHSCPRLKEAAVALIRANNLAVMATQGWAREILSHPKDMVVVTQLVAQLPASTSPPPAAEGGPTPGPQLHAGSSQTTAASEPATAAGSTSTPGSGAVSSQSAPAAAGGGSAPGQACSCSSQTPAAPTPAPPACNAPLPDDRAVSRYRSLCAAERGRRLIEAAKEGAAGEVWALLVAGADVGARDGDRRTALHHAARRGHADVASYLLAGGAEVDARDSMQDTPLHWAAVRGHTAVVRLLAAASADLNARNQWGMTPLHEAAKYGRAEAAAALLQAGADRRLRDDKGRTPLDRASNQRLRQLLAEG